MSDQEQNNDHIKRLLQQKLASNQPAEDGWNVPSDRVWAGLSEELKARQRAKRKRFFPIAYLVGLGALVALLLLRECAHRQDMVRMQQEIQRIQQECQEKQGTSEKRAPQNDTELPIGRSANPVHFFEEKTVVPASAHQQVKTDVALAFAVPKKLTTSPALLAHFSSGDSLVVPPAKTLSGSLYPLSTLPLLPIAPWNREKRVNIPGLYVKEKGETKLPFALTGNLRAGYARTGNRLSGERPSIISRQKALPAWRAGIGLEAVFNRRWSLLTGVDYNLSCIETQYRLQVPFTHVNEYQHDDGNFDNSYRHSLPSSLGNYPAEFVLTRAADSEIHEGDIMDLELTIKQQTRLLSLPLQLRRSFSKHRWEAGLQAGIAANYVLGVSAENSYLIPHHSAIHQRHTAIGAPALNELQRWSFDYSAGLDLRYLLTTRLGLSISSAYQAAFTPVYRDDSVKNYLHAWHAGVGLHFSLW